MEPITLDNNKAQMRKGILEYCILLILSRNDAYASEIITELKNAQMIVVEGTLYPLLMRQKNQGWLSYRWEESPQGPPRKYYSLTDNGRALLNELDGSWAEMVASIERLRKPSAASNESINQTTI
jgi:PadR family transcriptional regulator PadR